MTAPSFTNWAGIGFFPLQDHEEGVPIGMRQQLAGGRIASMSDSTDPAESVHVIATEDGMGTIGDLHPWFFWQTADREERDTGMWQGSFAGLVVEGKAAVSSGTSTGARPSGLLPIRTARGGGSADGRMKTKYPNVSKAMPFTPRGTMMLVMPGTDEANQQEIMLHCDSRIMAPNMFGPGSAGTLVCDMGPENEICMSDGVGGLTNSPGMAGRAARIQSLMRVIPFDASGGISRGNALALNFAASGQDGLAGFGLAWTAIEKAGAGGPTTGGGSYKGPGDVVKTRPPGYKGPITGGGNGGPSSNASSGGSTPMGASGSGDGHGGQGEFPGSMDGVTGGPVGGNENAGGRGRHPADGATVADFGKFEPRAKDGFGTMALSASMGGPLHGGSDKDPHKVGTDRDGNPINSAHLATAANWYRSWDEDGPMLFEGDFPGAGGFPLKAHTHLTWDDKGQIWRWWTEVPDMKPSTNLPPTTPGDKPPPWKPNGPTTPGNPGRPGTPGKPGSPGKPTTPSGGGSPGTPGPSGPSSPGPRGPSGGGPSGGGPFTPGPFGPYPRGKGYGWRAPGSPPNPKGPGTGGGGWNPPSPKPSGPAFGGDGPPGGPNEDGPPGRGPGQTPEPGPVGPSTGGGGKGKGWRAAGSPPTGPEPGKLTPIVSTNATRVDETSTRVVARDVRRVGETTIEDRGLMAYFRPTMSGFAGLTFRPQKWILGETNFLHNTLHEYEEALEDEAHRPQVVALHAFGATSTSTGEFNHVATPQNSRARGGTGDGGVMFTPPEFEPEDYFGINSYVDVETAATESLVMLTPGVALALGTPTVAGGLNVAGIAISQKFAATDKPLQVQQYSVAGVATTLFEARVSQTDSEERVTFSGTHSVAIPSGTTAQRSTTPIQGDLRVNVSGAADVVEFWENQASAWVALGAGGGGATTFLALTDTPAAYTALAGNTLRVNSANNALEFTNELFVSTTNERTGVHQIAPELRFHVTETVTSEGTTGIAFFEGTGGEVTTDNEIHVGTALTSNNSSIHGYHHDSEATRYGYHELHSGTRAITWNWNGKVGIGGETDPDEALHITGNAKLNDNGTLKLGTGSDAAIYYDAADLIIDPDVVGSGEVVFKGDVNVEGNTLTFEAGGRTATLAHDGFNLNFDTSVGNLVFRDNVRFNDNKILYFGSSFDARISYNATDMVIIPDSVGSGKLKIDGDINVVAAHDYYHDGVQGETVDVVIEDGAAVEHTLEFSGGILTGYSTV